ncbi:MAG: hypothetical protein WCK51_09660 [Armatimonadota bacterium]
MSSARPSECPKCGASWHPGRTICEFCGWDVANQVSGLGVFLAVMAVFPFMAIGYCCIGGPLAYVSPIFIEPLPWILLAVWLAWVVWKVMQPSGEKRD